MNSLELLVAFAITASVVQAAAMAQWCGTNTPYRPAPQGHSYPPMFLPFDVPPLPPPPLPPSEP